VHFLGRRSGQGGDYPEPGRLNGTQHLESPYAIDSRHQTSPETTSEHPHAAQLPGDRVMRAELLLLQLLDPPDI